MPKAKSKVQINNKKASYDYEFLETYDAGIVLVGTEIKSLRAGKASRRMRSAISKAGNCTFAE